MKTPSDQSTEMSAGLGGKPIENLMAAPPLPLETKPPFLDLQSGYVLTPSPASSGCYPSHPDTTARSAD